MYRLIHDNFAAYEGGNCVLGIYLAEKGFDALGRSGGECYTELAKHPEDMATMADVIRRFKRVENVGYGLSFGNQVRRDINVLIRANNANAPLEVLREALTAVGIAVEMTDDRPVEPSPYEGISWAEWPDVVPTG